MEPTYTITTLGRSMAKFPVAPRYARMLAGIEQKDLLPYVIIAVAALSVDELFVDFQNADKEVRRLCVYLGEMVGGVGGVYVRMTMCVRFCMCDCVLVCDCTCMCFFSAIENMSFCLFVIPSFYYDILSVLF